MSWSEDLKERLQNSMKLIEPNIKTGKDFVENLLSDIQKEAEAGREKVSEAKLDLEEFAQNLGARAKLTGERLEEIIRQEVQRQIDSYIKHQRELLSQTVVTYASKVQKMISGLAHQILGASTTEDEMSPVKSEEDGSIQAVGDRSALDNSDSKATAKKPRAKKTLPTQDGKARSKKT